MQSQILPLFLLAAPLALSFICMSRVSAKQKAAARAHPLARVDRLSVER